jgi:ABC-type methionine transport system ATPase subunit
MARRRIKLTFEPELIKQPVIYELSKQFNVITNIRRANVGDNIGWVVLEIEGSESKIDNGLEWMNSIGVRVDPVIGDIIEG